MTSTGSDDARGDVVASLTLPAEAIGLELTDEFEGERVVELTDIDIAGAETGDGERLLGCTATDVPCLLYTSPSPRD